MLIFSFIFTEMKHWRFFFFLKRAGLRPVAVPLYTYQLVNVLTKELPWSSLWSSLLTRTANSLPLSGPGWWSTTAMPCLAPAGHYRLAPLTIFSLSTSHCLFMSGSGIPKVFVKQTNLFQPVLAPLNDRLTVNWVYVGAHWNVHASGTGMIVVKWKMYIKKILGQSVEKKKILGQNVEKQQQKASN